MIVDHQRTKRRIAYSICDSGSTIKRFCELHGINRKAVYGRTGMNLETVAAIAKGLRCGIDDLVVYKEETE